MTLFEFKEKVKKKELNGLYVLSGPEYYIKKQYVDKIVNDYGLVKVHSFDELSRKLGKKTLTGKKLNNLLLYIESVKDLDLASLTIEGEGVVLIVSLDDKKDTIYFDKLNEEVIRKYTDSPLLKYRGQIEIVKDALNILGKTEKEILDVGLAEIELTAPSPEEYAAAIIVGDKRKLVRYNYILTQLEVSPYMYICAIIEMLSIYHLFLKNKNVFEGTNEAFNIGLNYSYSKFLREQFCRPKTEEEKLQGYGNWKTLRNLINFDCINIRGEVLDILLNNYMYYDAESVYNYLTFCL